MKKVFQDRPALNHLRLSDDLIAGEFAEILNYAEIFNVETGPAITTTMQLPQPDGTTGLYDLGVWVDGRTTSVVVKDHEGTMVSIPAGMPALEGARVQYDPDALWGTFTASDTTPSTLPTAYAKYSDGSTTGWEKNGKVSRLYASEENYDGVVTENDVLAVFFGSASGVTIINMNSNKLIGTMPDLSPFTAMTAVLLTSNKLTGSISNLSANTALQTVFFQTNELSGDIPDLSANSVLQTIYLSSNQLTGSIPNLSSNTALKTFDVTTNQITGVIPDLSSNTALNTFSCGGNGLTGFAGGWPDKAVNFNASSNALTESAVNQILIDADAALSIGNVPGTTIYLTGGTNAAPTGAGITAKNNLVANGATVTTN